MSVGYDLDMTPDPKKPKKIAAPGAGKAHTSHPKPPTSHRPAGQPQTSPSPKQAIKKVLPKTSKGTGSGRPPAHDWEALRLRYVTTDLTLEEVAAELPENERPALQTMQHRSSQEKWSYYRQQFKQLVSKEMEAKEAEVARVMASVKLGAIQEVRSRQAKLAREMQAVGRKILSGIAKDEARLKEATIYQAVRLLTAGMGEERKARGIEEYTVNLSDITNPEDLDRLTIPQLLELLTRRRQATGFDSEGDYAFRPEATEEASEDPEGLGATGQH